MNAEITDSIERAMSGVKLKCAEAALRALRSLLSEDDRLAKSLRDAVLKKLLSPKEDDLWEAIRIWYGMESDAEMERRRQVQQAEMDLYELKLALDAAPDRQDPSDPGEGAEGAPPRMNAY